VPTYTLRAPVSAELEIKKKPLYRVGNAG